MRIYEIAIIYYSKLRHEFVSKYLSTYYIYYLTNSRYCIKLINNRYTISDIKRDYYLFAMTISDILEFNDLLKGDIYHNIGERLSAIEMINNHIVNFKRRCASFTDIIYNKLLN